MDKIIICAITAVLGVLMLALLFKVIALIFKVLIPVVIIAAVIVIGARFLLKKEEA